MQWQQQQPQPLTPVVKASRQHPMLSPSQRQAQQAEQARRGRGAAQSWQQRWQGRCHSTFCPPWRQHWAGLRSTCVWLPLALPAGQGLTPPPKQLNQQANRI